MWLPMLSALGHSSEFIHGKYVVVSISAEESKVVVSIKLNITIPDDLDADWIKKHVAIYGK